MKTGILELGSRMITINNAKKIHQIAKFLLQNRQTHRRSLRQQFFMFENHLERSDGKIF